MSRQHSTADRLSLQKPEYLSASAAARLAGLPEPRRVVTHLTPDAWYSGPNGKLWPLYARETIEKWIDDGIRDGRCKAVSR